MAAKNDLKNDANGDAKFDAIVGGKIGCNRG